jgi:hypothetical protein
LKKYNQLFWIGFVSAALLAATILHTIWNHKYKKLPKRPPLINFRTQYLGDDESYSATHILYRYGLFGTDKTINSADLLLVGTSHMEFGISAKELEDILSKEYSRQLRVFNLGMGGGESTDFVKTVLSSKKIQNKVIIIDLHDPLGDNWSYLAKVTDSLSIIQAYIKIYNIWLDYLRDWYFDPIFPRFRPFLEIKNVLSISDINKKVFAYRRALGYFSVREWSSGDIVSYFGPTSGDLTDTKKVVQLSASAKCLDGENQGVRINHKLEAYLLANSNRVVTTLVPWDGCGLVNIPTDATNFIFLPSEDLYTFDRLHLVDSSRSLTTRNLAKGLIKKQILKAKK